MDKPKFISLHGEITIGDFSFVGINKWNIQLQLINNSL